MRALILSAMTILAAGSAAASSIERVGSAPARSDSVVAISCKHCPASKALEEVTGYQVPELPNGTQKVEVQDVDGHMKVMRTEAWIGGSPVTFVSAAPFWVQDDNGQVLAGFERPDGADGVDATARTSAVVGTEAAPTIAASAGGFAAMPALDTSAFMLRLN